MENFHQSPKYYAKHCTEVRFASLLSGGFITAIVLNPPESKLAKRTCVQRLKTMLWLFLSLHLSWLKRTLVELGPSP